MPVVPGRRGRWHFGDDIADAGCCHQPSTVSATLPCGFDDANARRQQLREARPIGVAEAAELDIRPTDGSLRVGRRRSIAIVTAP
jgi:hypothetical protein